MLPEHLKIGYEIYRVSIAAKGALEEGETGECDNHLGTILISPDQSVRRKMMVLLHEVFHACWHHADLPDGEESLAALKEEDIVSRLSTVLTAVLLDNPQLRQAIEQAAGSANSTCWRESVVTLPTIKAETDGSRAFIQAVEDERRRQERELNAPLYPQDNERRSEQPPHFCCSGDACRYPHCPCMPKF